MKISVDEQLDIIQDQIINFLYDFFNYKRIFALLLILLIILLITMTFGL
jgi:hypothetical protein